MANVFFISDIHAGHKNIHKFRTQFESEEHHYETIKENYHKVVTKRDKVFFLGDIAFTQERLEDVGKWTAERKVLILGNHCRDNTSMEEICKHFDEVYSLKRYKEFWLSHAPIHPEELRGKYCLHGHTHYHNIPDNRYFNCCLENTDWMPIDLNAVRKRLNLAHYKELGPLLEKNRMINKTLAKLQGLDEETIADIEQIHDLLQSLLAKANLGVFNTSVYNAIEKLEFQAQELWGFKQDPSYHTWKRLYEFRCQWVGRKFQCIKTGWILIIPKDVMETDFFRVGDGYVDVGRLNFYSRFSGVKEITSGTE